MDREEQPRVPHATLALCLLPTARVLLQTHCPHLDMAQSAGPAVLDKLLGKDKEIQSPKQEKKDWGQCRGRCWWEGSQDLFLPRICRKNKFQYAAFKWVFFLHQCFKPGLNEGHFELLKVKKMSFRHLENEQVFISWKKWPLENGIRLSSW